MHIDTKFAMATINNLEEVASTLGPNEVCFFSQDDKARVPIGITAANKQAPMLMSNRDIQVPGYPGRTATGDCIMRAVGIHAAESPWRGPGVKTCACELAASTVFDTALFC